MTLPSPHVSGVSDDQRYLHRGDVEEDRYIQGPGTPHITGHKDIDPGQAGQCQATIRLVPNVCVAYLRVSTCCLSSPRTRVNVRSPTPEHSRHYSIL